MNKLQVMFIKGNYNIYLLNSCRKELEVSKRKLLEIGLIKHA